MKIDASGPIAPMAAPAQRAEVPPARQVSRRTRLAYGFGTIAYGIKNNGFQTVLLLFYNQIIGLPADTVGLVIMAALIVDGLVDPVIGHFSDQTRSRWGRRHPWMYAAAIPVGLTYLLLWNPPRGDSTTTLWYLAGITILVRTAISCYEVPCTALGPELTSDYHERTVLAGYREVFGWIGSMGMTLLLFAVLLRPTTQYPVGQLNPEGYRLYGMIAGAAMTIAILISARGTHSEIHFLPKPGPPLPLGSAFANLRSALRNRAFQVLLASNLVAFTGTSLTLAMSVYANTYLWEFSAASLAWFTLSIIAGVALAFIISQPAARRWGKRNAAVAFVVLYILLATLPLLARLMRVFPANDSPLLLPILLGFTAIYAGFGIANSILFVSMMSDVVEDDQARTGMRSEGMFFAGNFFVLKCATGLGLFLTGLVISWVGFPTGAKPGEVPLAVLDNLIIVYCTLTWMLGIAGAIILSRYPIGESDHNTRVTNLAAANGQAVRAE